MELGMESGMALDMELGMALGRELGRELGMELGMVWGTAVGTALGTAARPSSHAPPSQLLPRSTSGVWAPHGGDDHDDASDACASRDHHSLYPSPSEPPH